MTSPHETQPEDDRVSETPEGLSGIVRRVLSHHPSPEERLEQLLAERRRELAEQAAVVEQTLDDLERREEQLRDARASIERLLRLGQRDLDLRESDLVRLGRELTERQVHVENEEAELARRRVELGAVELKRAALEQRDRALAAREASVEAREAEVEPGIEAGTEVEAEVEEPVVESASDAVSDEEESTFVLFVPGAGYRLAEVVRKSPTVGEQLELDDTLYVVARVGRSPLPGDDRRCAYLMKRGPRHAASAGTS
jgi:hypothetical protein